MKKSSLTSYILLTLVALVIWLAGSWWHYACNIKNTCGKPNTIAANQGVNKAPPIDTDGDGLSDAEEARLGTDPLLTDSDQDSISDSEEVGVNLEFPLDSDEDNLIDALDFDDDNDGLSTFDEEQIGTSSLHADTDEDGILDAVEVGANINAPLDTDGDGIINALDTDDDDDNIDTIKEALLGTNPLLNDSDGDGISDSEEIGENTDKPLDKNQNGILDAVDTDEKRDQDNDGLSDLIEAQLNTDPTKTDSDDHRINDAIEIGPKINKPLDTDNDGILNLNDKDDDNDNLSTRYETRIGTNPLSSDSDNDGLLDNIEAKAPNSDVLQDTDNDELINPIDSDDDNDTISTFDELALGTDPLKADSDDDGIADAIEIGPDLKAALDSDKDGIIDALDTIVDKIESDSPAPDTDMLTNTDANTDNKSVSLELTSSENNDSIQSSILYFPYLSADPVIKGNAADYLDKVAAWLKQNPENKINLIGHTDNIGSKQSNLALGIRRVMVIRELLINRGSPIMQIEIMSRGESQPIMSNKTEAGRLKNRRVEIAPYK